MTERTPCTAHADDDCFLCYPDWLEELDAETPALKSQPVEFTECTNAEMQAFIAEIFERVYPQFPRR